MELVVFITLKWWNFLEISMKSGYFGKFQWNLNEIRKLSPIDCQLQLIQYYKRGVTIPWRSAGTLRAIIIEHVWVPYDLIFSASQSVRVGGGPQSWLSNDRPKVLNGRKSFLGVPGGPEPPASVRECCSGHSWAPETLLESSAAGDICPNIVLTAIYLA